MRRLCAAASAVSDRRQFHIDLVELRGDERLPHSVVVRVAVDFLSSTAERRARRGQRIALRISESERGPSDAAGSAQARGTGRADWVWRARTRDMAEGGIGGAITHQQKGGTIAAKVASYSRTVEASSRYRGQGNKSNTKVGGYHVDQPSSGWASSQAFPTLRSDERKRRRRGDPYPSLRARPALAG